MTEKKKDKCCGTTEAQDECCRIESVVTVDERGQLVLPKDVREDLGIKPGEKMAVIAVKGAKGVCCITLLKAEALSGSVKIILKPMLGEKAKDKGKEQT